MSEHISETKELTCIGCPLGCAITVTLTDGTVSSVTGNTCPRGDAYARKEVTNPTRIVTRPRQRRRLPDGKCKNGFRYSKNPDF